MPLPKECSRELGNGEGDSDLARRRQLGISLEKGSDSTYGDEEEYHFEHYEEEREMYPAKANHTTEEDDLDGYADKD